VSRIPFKVVYPSTYGSDVVLWVLLEMTMEPIHGDLARSKLIW
jgi:hypothetical protein